MRGALSISPGSHHHRIAMGALILRLLVLAIFSTAAAQSSSPNLRGTPPQDEGYYKTATIMCRDGTGSFSQEQLNDDFCDCPDGTDEPGTSACANGKFYCQNKGHKPLFIFSSRVNDGICDCCDGSDEYDGKAKCANTCLEAGSVWREKLKKKIATFKAGLEARNRDVEHSQLLIGKDKKDLENLKIEEKNLRDVVQKLGAKKEAIEKEEEKERLEREKEEKARKDAEIQKAKREAEMQKAKEEAAEEQGIETEGEEQYVEEDHEIEKQDSKEDIEHTEGVEDDTDFAEQKVMHSNTQEFGSAEEKTTSEGLSKEELGRLVASRWTGENPNIEKEAPATHAESEEDFDEDQFDNEHHLHDEDHLQDDDLDNDQEEDESSTDDEDDDEDESPDAYDRTDATQDHNSLEGNDSQAEPSFWSKFKSFFNSFSGFYSSPRLSVDKSDADQIRKEYKEFNSKLTSIRTKISDLEKKLGQDFGKDGEFYSLYGKCFEFEENKYTYKVCPFRHGVQMEGRSTTTLGNWDGFKDDYKSMQFVRGDKCWNGPDRSLKVRLRCGAKVELRDVDEPSRCEYVAQLSTPAACRMERLTALQHQLDGSGDVAHDEL